MIRAERVAALARLGPGPDGRPVRRRVAVAARDLDRRGHEDDYYLDLGAQAFRAELARIGVPDDRIHFELFPATHAAIDYRYPMALAGWRTACAARRHPHTVARTHLGQVHPVDIHI